jgi:hypothetical protein
MQQTQRTISPYTILGIKPGRPKSQIEAIYRRLAQALDDEQFTRTPQCWVQSQQAYLAVEDAYARIADGSAEEEREYGVDYEDEPIPARLGQMLVAEGLITLEQLEQALKDQASNHAPLGEILKTSSLITQMELDAFLLNQRLLRLPADSPHHIGQRLIGMGLITEDMLRIALLEQRTKDAPLGTVLIEHCWVAPEILAAIMESREERAELAGFGI